MQVHIVRALTLSRAISSSPFLSSSLARTLSRDAQVQSLLQNRTALLGSSFDLSTRSSLRVEARHGPGASVRLGESSGFGSSSGALGQGPQGAVEGEGEGVEAAKERWSLQTIPSDRTASKRMNGAFASLSHPSRSSRLSSHTSSTTSTFNSRRTEYASEYASSFCDSDANAAGGAAKLVTDRSDFFARSQRSFLDPLSYPLDCAAHSTRPSRPLTPSQPLLHRQAQERVSSTSLEQMKHPVWRKSYPTLLEEPERVRAQPYSFDLRTHISTMRPHNLFKNQVNNQQYVSDNRIPGRVEYTQTQEKKWNEQPTEYQSVYAMRQH